MPALRINGDYPYGHISPYLHHVLNTLDTDARKQLGDVSQSAIAQKVDERAVGGDANHPPQGDGADARGGAARLPVGCSRRLHYSGAPPAKLVAGTAQRVFVRDGIQACVLGLSLSACHCGRPADSAPAPRIRIGGSVDGSCRLSPRFQSTVDVSGAAVVATGESGITARRRLGRIRLNV